MTERFQKALRKAIHDKIGCCEETLIINEVFPKEQSYTVFYYVPSLDRHVQTQSTSILLTELMMNLD